MEAIVIYLTNKNAIGAHVSKHHLSTELGNCYNSVLKLLLITFKTIIVSLTNYTNLYAWIFMTTVNYLITEIEVVNGKISN